MSVAFSEHLLKSYESKPPFDDTSQLQHSPMAYNPYMHGTFPNQHPYSSGQPQPLYQSLSDESVLKLNLFQTKLNQKLGPEYIAQRPSGGGKVTYLEGWKAINLANEIFGFNGWSSSVLNITTDFLDCVGEAKRYNMGVTATVRVTLRDGAFHEDCGVGSIENAKSKVAALEKCKKEAVTDALKRALRNFGNVLGNCLYDKSFVNEVIKIKVQPPKFDKSELHRKPEFEEPQPSTSAASPTIKSEPQSKPISSVPPHMRPQTTTPRTPHAQPQSSYSASTNINTPPPPYNPRNTVAPQNASMHRQLPQPQPQLHSNPKLAPQKKGVTFAEPTTTDADESFAFSDDDAFLAAVDMGEGDMGKPIDYDEGIGGVSSPSDFSISNETSNGPPAGASATHGNPTLEPQSRQSSNPTLNQSTSHLQIQNQNAHRQPSCVPQQQGAVQQPTVLRTINSNHQSNTGSSRLQQQQSNGYQSEGTSSVQNQNQNPPPPPPGRISDQRVTVPKLQSMGSFVFPTGVDAQSLSPHPPAQRVSPGTSSGTFGLKRSVDTMKRPGMGLAQQQRRPLGNLEMSEGGDIKRPRY